MMKLIICLLIVFVIPCCRPVLKIPAKPGVSIITGSGFFKTVAAWKWQQRDSLAVRQILAGNIPALLKKFVCIRTSINDSNGNKIKARYFVMPDYLSIGTNNDWARVPLTPGAAQIIADSFNCFLSTRKIADDIYAAAKIRLEPVPMYAYRDSSPTMWQHHLIIEGQRKGRPGLIAGIKKDVVISGKLVRDSKTGRVAIYGWHTKVGKPIQPLYTGHVNWYVDYSHGIRLVYRTIWVNNRPMDYINVLKDPQLCKLLCDEEFCDVYRY